MKRFFFSVFVIGVAIWAVAGGTAFASLTPVVPEPATWVLLGSGLAGLAAWRWYHRK